MIRQATEEPREIAVISRQANEVLTQAQHMIITTPEQHIAAAEFLKNVKGLQKKVMDTFGPIVKAALNAHREAKAKEKEHLGPLEEAEYIVKRAVGSYETRVRQARLEEERKAREKAAQEEAKRRAELEAQARNHEAKGRTDKAEERRAQAEQVYVPPAPVQTEAPKVEGLSMRENWTGELLNLEALVKAVAEGKAPISFLQADMVAIRKQARATKNTMHFPGIRFYAETTMAVRA